MGMPAARMTDQVLQDAPHCHAPIHPPAPTPTPVPHPPLPLMIIKGAPTVMIGKMPAARVTDQTAPCMLPGCIAFNFMAGSVRTGEFGKFLLYLAGGAIVFVIVSLVPGWIKKRYGGSELLDKK